MSYNYNLEFKQPVNGTCPRNYYSNLSQDEKNQILNSIFNDPNYDASSAQNVMSADEFAADDGKISFEDKAGNFVKGLFSPITSMFSSPKNFLIGAASIAGIGALTIATGGAITPLLVAGGVVAGGVQFASGAYKAANATTDEEARQAWQGMGAGTTSVAMSVAGAKSALKAAGVQGASEMGALEATAQCFKNSPKAFATSVGKFGSMFTAGSKTASTAASVAGSLDDAASAVDDVANVVDDVVKVDYSKPGTYTDSSGHTIVVDQNGTGIYIHDKNTFQVTTQGGAQQVYGDWDGISNLTKQPSKVNDVSLSVLDDTASSVEISKNVKSSTGASVNDAPQIQAPKASSTKALPEGNAKTGTSSATSNAAAQPKQTNNFETQVSTFKEFSLNGHKKSYTQSDSAKILETIKDFNSGNAKFMDTYQAYKNNPTNRTLGKLQAQIAKLYHPDLNQGSESAATIFKIVYPAIKQLKVA